MEPGSKSHPLDQQFWNRANSLFQKEKYSKLIELINKSGTTWIQDSNLVLIYAQALRKSEQSKMAFEVLSSALALHSLKAELWAELGYCLTELNDIRKALEAFVKAGQIDQQNAEIKLQIGLCHFKLGNDLRAINLFLDVLNLNQKSSLAWLNLGNAFVRTRDISAAIEAFSMIYEDDVNYPMARFNRSLCDLLKGEFETGWTDYEWRRKIKGSEYQKLNLPLRQWDGQSKGDEKIFISSEQGIGDEVFFARWLRYLSTFKSHFTVAIDERLIPLYSRSFSNITFVSKMVKSQITNFDAYIPIGSLPLLLKKYTDCGTSYLIQDQNRSDKLRQKINPDNQFVVGISWISKNSGSGIFRSVQLNQMLSLFENLDLKIISLQYGDSGTEFAALAQKDQRLDIAPFVDKFGDVDSLASLISACDLVVSVDNSTVHFSGALGKKTFVMLNHAPDWRWGLNDQTTNWYASHRLFRQTQAHSWEKPLTEVKLALEEHTKNSGRTLKQ